MTRGELIEIAKKVMIAEMDKEQSWCEIDGHLDDGDVIDGTFNLHAILGTVFDAVIAQATDVYSEKDGVKYRINPIVPAGEIWMSEHPDDFGRIFRLEPA